MKIFLFRHGEKQDLNPSKNQEIGLTNVGIQQITKLGNFLKINFPDLISSDFIYSSPIKRTIQSAKIIQNILNIKDIIKVSEFKEFYPIKDFSQPKEIRDHILNQCYINPDFIAPDFELSLNQILYVFEKKIREICFNSKQKNIIISSHGAIIRNFIYSLDSQTRPKKDQILESKIQYGSLTILNFNDNNFSINQFNIHNFLID